MPVRVGSSEGLGVSAWQWLALCLNTLSAGRRSCTDPWTGFAGALDYPWAAIVLPVDLANSRVVARRLRRMRADLENYLRATLHKRSCVRAT